MTYLALQTLALFYLKKKTNFTLVLTEQKNINQKWNIQLIFQVKNIVQRHFSNM